MWLDSWLLMLLGARVGLKQTIYRVSEDVNVVELCVIVYEPIIDCPIEFSFEVKLSTIDKTAGID